MHAGVAIEPLELHRNVEQFIDLRIVLAHFLQFGHLLQRLFQARLHALHRRRNHFADPVGLRIRHLQNAGNVADHRLGLQFSVRNNLRHMVKTVFVLHIFNRFVAVFLTEVDVKVRHVDTFRV